MIGSYGFPKFLLFFEFSRSTKHNSFVRLQKMDFMTPKGGE